MVVGLAVANVARSAVVPGRWHLAWNLGAGLYAVITARVAGLGVAELGLDPRRLPAGLRVGGAAFGAISAVVAVGAVTGLLENERAEVSGAEMARRALIVIPLGTVLVEELAFRGSLHGLLERTALPTAAATATGAVLFGLWHAAPIWSDGALLATATIAATTVAGAGFIWLRRRSDSLVAPILAHLATNSTTFALAWWATRAG